MNPDTDSSVDDLWNEFIRANAEYETHKVPDSWYFCDHEKDADECANLVVRGIKQATSSSLWWFEENNASKPKVGDLNIVTNWNGTGKAIIRTTKVEQIPFNKITKEHAAIEGEGDKSLSYWKKVHWDYFSREMKPSGKKPTEDMIIIYEQFDTIWT